MPACLPLSPAHRLATRIAQLVFNGPLRARAGKPVKRWTDVCLCCVPLVIKGKKCARAPGPNWLEWLDTGGALKWVGVVTSCRPRGLVATRRPCWGRRPVEQRDGQTQWPLISLRCTYFAATGPIVWPCESLRRQ